MARINQSELNDLSEKLLKEAIEALRFALKHNYDYCKNNDTGLLKQSIMNFHRFIEFTLKHFIADINPLLIFDKPFEEKFNLKNAKTISFTQALNFFSHNHELNILQTSSDFDKKKFVKTLCLLRDLRNEVAHLFLPVNDEKELQIIFSDNVRLIYLIFIQKNIYQKVEQKLSKEENEMLKELIDVEQEKLKKEEQIKLANALELVELYEAQRRTSLDPKEYNPLEAPIYDCPNCSNHTFILTPDNKFFNCTYCEEEEDADECSGPFGCGSGLIPDCYLRSWDEEHGNKICENCFDEFEDRCNKE